MAKILVVDDDLSVHVAVSKALSGDGHVTRTAFTGEEGLARFQSERFDLLITDIAMPKLDGVAMLAKLREKGILEGLPFMLVAGPNERETYRIAQDVGAIDIVAKPVEAKELLLRVRRALEKRKGAVGGPKGAAPAQPSQGYAQPAPATGGYGFEAGGLSRRYERPPAAASGVSPAPPTFEEASGAHPAPPGLPAGSTSQGISFAPPTPPRPQPQLPGYSTPPRGVAAVPQGFGLTPSRGIPTAPPAGSLAFSLGSPAADSSLAPAPPGFEPPSPPRGGPAPPLSMDDFAAPPPPAASRAAADAFARERELDAPAESIAPATPPPAPLPPAPAPPRQRPPGPRSWGADTNATVVPAPPVPGSSDDWFAASGSVAPAPPGFGNMSARGAQPPPPQAQPQPPAVEETVRRRNIRGTGAMASAYATPAQAERPDCVGQVGNIAVAELVRFMFLGKKSGIVDVSHEEFRGEIAFSQGEIVKAATSIEDREVNRSLVALKTMCGWRQGRFKIVFCDVAANPNAVKTTAAFLAEQFGTAPLERG